MADEADDEQKDETSDDGAPFWLKALVVGGLAYGAYALVSDHLEVRRGRARHSKEFWTSGF